MSDKRLSRQDIADHFGVRARTVTDWVRKGVLEPGERIGLRRLGWRTDVVDALRRKFNEDGRDEGEGGTGAG